MVGARKMASFSAIATATTATAATGAVSFSSSSSKMTSSSSSKILYIVRHGQAMHNPRAEAAKDKGCSVEEFFELMRQDDALDADLTDLGRQQAKKCHEDNFMAAGERHDDNNKNSNPLGIDLVVASCLSRTIDTADLCFPPSSSLTTTIIKDEETDLSVSVSPRRISIDLFREVNGNLLNGKRRTKSELVKRHTNWNFDSLTTEEDESWTPEMEKHEDTAERGYRGLVELMTTENSTNTILLACHGGILRYMMNTHPLVHLFDERTTSDDDDDNDNDNEAKREMKSIESRFENCELRKYRLSWKDYEGDDDNDNDEDDGARRAIVLTQLDH